MDQTVDKALQNIEHLNVQQKLDLVEKVIQKLKKNTSPHKLDWRHLYGRGKGIWQDIDAQDYVNDMRKDR